MKSLLLLSLSVATVNPSPFDALEKLPTLKSYVGHEATYPHAPKGSTLIYNKAFFDETRRLTVTAAVFPRASSINSAIQFRDKDRQGASIAMSLPEFEKDGFRIHFVANPKWLETDLVVGKLWVQVALDRGKYIKSDSDDGDTAIAKEFRGDTKSYKLFKAILPEIKRLAKLASQR